MARSTLTNLGYRTYFETDAFLQLQAPQNLPPIDLMKILNCGSLLLNMEDPEPFPRSTNVLPLFRSQPTLTGHV
jgi:hypothetical protein